MADETTTEEKELQQTADTAVASEGSGLPEPAYGTVKISVSSDKMTARIELNIEKGQLHPTSDMLKSALDDAGVVFGIHEDELEAVCKYGTSRDVAFGQSPENGTDAEIIRHFNLGEKGRPKLIEYDRVDYKDMNLFVLAKKGQLLAERKRQTGGVPGTNVLGGTIKAKAGKPIQLKEGKNTYIENEDFLYANMDGQILDTGKVISIDPFLQIQQDISVGTGNIDFTGAVSVKGSIDYGFKLRATGDVEISGMVNGGEIEAENIIVKGGIQGMNRGSIVARGEIHASYAENAKLIADGSIFISDVALHSTMQAGHKICVTGKRGRIVGGRVQAGELVEATQIGNKSNVVTEIQVGVNPMLQERHTEAINAYKAAKKKLDQIKKTAETLANMDQSKMSEDRQRLVRETAAAKFKLLGEIEKNDKLIEALEEEMKALQQGFVRVSDVMFPGVKLKISNVIKTVQTAEQHCVLKVDGDTIRTAPY
ncbi:FapA family protein [Selenomonas sp. TAMA-11512]|uniref:DUF342 domain-containing protein n=1 Tax=Selenomonas sp. TAMA-11512 TaxID=3095337 RepID=UPI003086877B|nr:FapA family protein [Selenomonas sp. TAMA-11512]